MDTKTAAALAAAVLVVAGGIAVGTGTIDLGGDGDMKVSADAGPRTQLARMSDADKAALAYAVYAVDDLDGGQAPLALMPDGGQVLLDQFPCRRRTLGSKPGDCNLLLPDGGERDFGEQNTIQPGLWVDHGGCEPTACVAVFK